MGLDFTQSIITSSCYYDKSHEYQKIVNIYGNFYVRTYHNPQHIVFSKIYRDPQTHTYFDILLHNYFQEHHLWKLNKAERWMVWPCLETLEDMLEYSSGWH